MEKNIRELIQDAGKFQEYVTKTLSERAESAKQEMKKTLGNELFTEETELSEGTHYVTGNHVHHSTGELTADKGKASYTGPTSHEDATKKAAALNAKNPKIKAEVRPSSEYHSTPGHGK